MRFKRAHLPLSMQMDMARMTRFVISKARELGRGLHSYDVASIAFHVGYLQRRREEGHLAGIMDRLIREGRIAYPVDEADDATDRSD